MPKFTVRFFTEADWAQTTIKAPTAKAALKRARAMEHRGETWVLDFQHYDSTSGIEQIEVANGAGEIVEKWNADELCLHLAAGDLYAALKQAMHALNSVPRFSVPAFKSDSQAIAAACATALDAAAPRRGRSR
jgi:hypothetical protein